MIFLIGGFLGKNSFRYLERFLINEEYYIARIKGHTDDQVIPPFRDWILEVENQFLKYAYGEVFLIGFSMGCIIASYLNLHYGYMIKKMVFISPAFYHYYYNHLGLNIFKEIRIPKLRKGVFNGLKELKKLSDQAQQYNWLRYIECPLLMIIGNQDGFIDKKSGDKIINQVGSKKKLIKFFNANHEVFKSAVAHDIVLLIIDFLKM